MCGADNTWPGNKLQAAGEGGGINPEAFATTTPVRLEERDTQVCRMKDSQLNGLCFKTTIIIITLIFLSGAVSSDSHFYTHSPPAFSKCYFSFPRILVSSYPRILSHRRRVEITGFSTVPTSVFNSGCCSKAFICHQPGN